MDKTQALEEIDRLSEKINELKKFVTQSEMAQQYTWELLNVHGEWIKSHYPEWTTETLLRYGDEDSHIFFTPECGFIYRRTRK